MKPIVLIPSGDADADFTYATGFSVESGLYVRFAEADDVLVASPLEIDRAREQSRVGRVMGLAEAGYEEAGPFASYPRLAARLLRERGHEAARVSPRLQAGYLEELRATGLEVEVDRDLFRAERRRKSPEEAGFIEASQRAAEAAVVEVVSLLAQADVGDEGVLWLDGSPLTSERLYARASLLLGERGFTCPDMIIAGSPECAMPHFRGAGPIRAGAPVIIDIFPSSRTTHYHGDLTRTVVVGEIPDEVRRMHAAALQALDAGIESIRDGASGRDVHNAVCQVLVDRGYGTSTRGFEGPGGGAEMNHSTGHGVGLDIHEEPALKGPDDNLLAAGDVVTVEPGLYLLGFGGVRVEDTGMVTGAGFRNFTTLTRSLDPRDYL
jgi:Xaa-Pro aminopeptidase